MPGAGAELNRLKDTPLEDGAVFPMAIGRVIGTDEQPVPGEASAVSYRDGKWTIYHAKAQLPW